MKLTIKELKLNIEEIKRRGYVSKLDSRYIKMKELERELKNAQSEAKMKHKCGCITRKEKGVIIFPCDYHKYTGKWIYIALQHKKKKEIENEN
jgi:hypothetical protein